MRVVYVVNIISWSVY